MPLVNELVIGLPDKDKFNDSLPNDDAQFLNYVTNPSLPVLLHALFGGAAEVPGTPRDDLVAAFLTGVKGLNQPAKPVPNEMLRLNTATPVTAIAPKTISGSWAATMRAFRMAGAPTMTWWTSRCGWPKAHFAEDRKLRLRNERTPTRERRTRMVRGRPGLTPRTCISAEPSRRRTPISVCSLI